MPLRIASYISTPHSICAGAPQGSSSSSLLFYLSFSSITYFLSSTPTSFHSFADDIYLSSPSSLNSQHDSVVSGTRQKVFDSNWEVGEDDLWSPKMCQIHEKLEIILNFLPIVCKL